MDSKEIGASTRPEGPLVRAAQYVRMSTEHQKYSTENQAEIIARYAQTRGFEIVRTYADQGKSGLSLEGRAALKSLFDDVKGGRADFEAILVYDVSRWGRFQDTDESAYYEYICREAGITVHFCAEQFENDGSLSATIIKSMKRAMAGEYSRELSAKVFTGQCRLITLGFRHTLSFVLRHLFCAFTITLNHLSRTFYRSHSGSFIPLIVGQFLRGLCFHCYTHSQ